MSSIFYLANLRTSAIVQLLKVTTPEDLYAFRAMIQYKETEQVFGFSQKEVPEKLVK